METLRLQDPIPFEAVAAHVFGGPSGKVELPAGFRARVEKTHRDFLTKFEQREPIYGVTTGFGDSCFRRVSVERSEQLQENLIRYLSCGTGNMLRTPVRRAIVLFRLLSLARGLSGVSWELIERMQQLVENDWLPLIPAEGSLGASGDLVPLAYVAGAVQGWGEVDTPQGRRELLALLAEAKQTPYRLKPKEGLALVNGTSAMVGQAYVNVTEFECLAHLAELESAWLCLAVEGRPESFGPLVNANAKQFTGQRAAAAAITQLLNEERYTVSPFKPSDSLKEFPIQDRYSLRCAPQILGPILDTVALVKGWVALEINGVSDNPLFDPADGSMASGGNFYGGYLSQGMDYLKISIAHAADLLDRQIALLVDEKANRGLPANLANWPGMAPEERSLHHGLKGLHQAISAVTSEVLNRSMPNGVFSRSTESHNQDKVSLGMSAAMECEGQLDKLFRLHAMALVCLAQAIDLRGIKLQGATSRFWYEAVRSLVPFVERDQILDKGIQMVAEKIRQVSHQAGGKG